MVDTMASDTPNWASTRPPSSRPTSTKSSASRRPSSRTSDESTPLLARHNSVDVQDGPRDHEGRRSPAASSLLRSMQAQTPDEKKKWLWPSIIALILLCVFAAGIILLGFFVPEVMEEYAMQAQEFKLSSVSLLGFTATGARARVQGVFWMDAGKVKKKSVRDLGVFGTWIAQEVETKESKVEVVLPDYADALIGIAIIPPIKLHIRRGQRNDLDFLVNLEPGDVDGIQRVANDWLEGNLELLNVQGRAKVKIRSGIINLPTQTITESILLEGHDIPGIPAYNISRLNVQETSLSDGTQGVEADASVTIFNGYPVDLTLPRLGFGILVEGCLPLDPLIMVGDATVASIHIKPKIDVQLDAAGVVRRLPESLTRACPGSDKSPLDTLLSGYMHGKATTVYVSGSKSPPPDTPKWISDLISSVTVPVPLPGRALGGLIRNFSLSDAHFSLPDPLAAPGAPESWPQISASIEVVAALPKEMNVKLDVNNVRAAADIFYKTKMFGRLDVREWQPANSTRIEPHHDEQQPTLLIESKVKDVPLKITDDDVFSEVVQALVLGEETLLLTVEAEVDVQVKTALGEMTVRKVPAEGTIPVKPVATGRDAKTFDPKVASLRISETSESSMTIEAELNFTNPTIYSASVPYVDINILVNSTVLGHVTVRNITVGRGNNTGVVARVTYDPLSASGPSGRDVGCEMLSQYISGYNITLMLRTHEGTLPSQPALGRALEALKIVVSAPRLSNPPSDGGDSHDDGKPHFIQGATMHLLSSTAEFQLSSPFSQTSLFINFLNATALYKDDEIGHIYYGEEFDGLPEEFEVRPGSSITPRLPVDWSLGSIGYEAVRKAIGGTLKLSAEANVGVRIGKFKERIWYKGGGIGAHIRL